MVALHRLSPVLKKVLAKLPRCGKVCVPLPPPVVMLCSIGLVVCMVCAVFATAEEAESGNQGEPSVMEAEAADEESGRSMSIRVQELVDQLDAADFARRNEATRRLVARGPDCLPNVVAALGAEPRETRFRAAEILRHSFRFDDLAPYLTAALGESYHKVARNVLHTRALEQVATVAQLENTRRLFHFWGTDIQTLHREVHFDLPAVKDSKEAEAVIAPLVGLEDKALTFNQMLTRLEQLSLSFQHQHSAGYTIVKTLADGLLEDDKQRIAFADRYIAAFESLAAQLRNTGSSSAQIRKEIADRANLSDGAAGFLVQLIDPQDPARRRLRQDLQVAPAVIEDEFFRGLALADSRECYRCVGKVHIADMLVENLDKWPHGQPALESGRAVAAVIEAAVGTVETGDKPKSLALLDALEGVAKLYEPGTDVSPSWRDQLTSRLCHAALQAANTREYHPVRAVHDRIVRVFERGITPESELFPADLVQAYLRSEKSGVHEQTRFGLDKYLTMIDRLDEAGLTIQHPTSTELLARMRGELQNNSPLLRQALAAVTRVTSATEGEEKQKVAVEKALQEWLEQTPAGPQ